MHRRVLKACAKNVDHSITVWSCTTEAILIRINHQGSSALATGRKTMVVVIRGFDASYLECQRLPLAPNPATPILIQLTFENSSSLATALL